MSLLISNQVNPTSFDDVQRNEYQTQGEHSISWNGIDNSGNKVGGGLYLYQVKTGDFVQTKKMVLVK